MSTSIAETPETPQPARPKRKNASPQGLACERPAGVHSISECVARALEPEECRCELVRLDGGNQAQLDAYLDEIKATPEVRFAANVFGFQKCYHITSRQGIKDVSLTDLAELLHRADPEAMRERDEPTPVAFPAPAASPGAPGDRIATAAALAREARIRVYAARAEAGESLFHEDDVEEDAPETPVLTPEEVRQGELASLLSWVRNWARRENVNGSTASTARPEQEDSGCPRCLRPGQALGATGSVGQAKGHPSTKVEGEGEGEGEEGRRCGCPS